HIAIGCFLGIPLVLYHGWLLAAIGAAGFLIALSYTASRFSLKYNAFGEAAVFTAFGPLAGSAAAVSATGTAPVPTILISCGPGLLAASVLLINNIRDRKTDRKAGAVTIPVLIGRGKSVVLLFLLMLLPYSIVAGGVLYSLFHQYIMVVLLTLPLAGKIWLDVKGARTPGSYTAALKQTVVLHTAYVVFCTVSLVFT
ncbi:MAG: prenyltransferase, partial [Spirochaetota bacterium]